MFGITEPYEKWMDKPLFNCPSDDRHAYMQLVHMKCFAVTIMNSCVMNILVVKAVQFYLTRLLGVCALMILLSPSLVGKVIPIVLLVLSFYIPYFRGYIHFRYIGILLILLNMRMEVQGFEFLFDLYLILCYVFEAAYSSMRERRFNVLATIICEFGMWTIPCSMWFRIGE
ncbi:hypothetical protein HNY73_020986 [Argiope bruennichi]|uniref:Uncharacterized protein n=1 Tax=Argiope bruennichi TaxID=94029 RepID=A0A8T0EDB1_ARGBR|nr:hypothetical protein HNY73_020986 [Argiope bruennichi]